MKTARKNSNGVYVSIRSKLVAAVAMLLVASFMVVSSSYAWFTLSTAPEVTGIHTAVGANGNLEIALDEGQEPGTGVGHYGNNAWGNLVDLNNSLYHLDKITLMPAALNIVSDLKMDTGIPLKVPKYGSDGRILSMDGTISAKADGNGAFKNSGTGVRGIGTSSGMSAQKLDYRSALSQISASTAQIKLYASQSLATSGSQLASAVVGYASNGSDTTKTYNINTVESVITNLTKANEEIVKMIKSYFKAQLAYAEASLDEDTYRAHQTALNALSVEQLFSSSSVTIPEVSQIRTLYTKYQAINSAITQAAAEVKYYTETEGKSLEAVPWEETVGTGETAVTHGVKAIFIDSGLVKLNDMKLNGYAANKDLLTNESLVSDIMRDGAILQMGAGCGVYSEFAEIAGNYTVEITIAEIVYGTLKVTNIAARMATTIENAPTLNVATELQEPTSGSASTEISDFYGYAIDLQFRTNAKDSHLMLQTTPTNRIYSSGGSEETAGHGSTMTFESTDNNFNTENVKNLMKFIRVVFTQEGEIVGVGILDPQTFVTNELKVTASIRLVKFTTPVASDGSYSLELTKKQASDEYDFIDTTDKGATELMALAQNTIAKLSVYVYLDGEELENGDVAATSATSMTGSLNLQFSSDANLVPMEYAALRDPLAEETTSTSAQPEQTTEPTT